ncbi:Homoserine dehydrogenase [hydrothermal vent metagenome]|uniref:Homoserine dehydrogenase n=1 Tax=hydrothermal vent metagenome TaxID=652676 RepID=A0A3B1CD08_9ZZZZ
MRSVKIGLIGCGVVGEGFVDLLDKRKESISARVGAPVKIIKIAVRDKSKKRGRHIDEALLTQDPFEVVNSPEVNIVVEVMGGEDPALKLMLKAAENGKSIVTANKHLLALHGERVCQAVESAKVELGFEAAVAGAVPIINSLKGPFAGDGIVSIQGIVNGTCNYILSRMTDEGCSFADALNEAQTLGYAEADPAFDVEGIDSAHKIAILASLVFETPVDFADINAEGITSITQEDVAMAKEFGFRVKSLAIAKRAGDKIDIRVHPAMIAGDNPIAKVNGALNAIAIKGESAGMNMLVGPGAGAGPTASAVMGDVVEIARKILSGSGNSLPMNVPVKSRKKLGILPINEVKTQFYLRLTVPDRPGVLAMIAGALGEFGVSIASMIQRGREENKPVSVVLMTHAANGADLACAIEKIKTQNILNAPAVAIRIENGEK